MSIQQINIIYLQVGECRINRPAIKKAFDSESSAG